MLTNVALFDNNFFVDSSDGPPSEADNMRLSLEDLGHTVTPFTGIMAADFQTALNGADLLVIPELENSALHSSLDVAAQTEIFDFVNNGGGLIINGSFFGRDEALLNEIFGFSLVEGGVPFLGFSEATGAVVGTAFEGGPASVDNNFETFLWDTASLPPGASSLYQDDLTAETAVASIPVGSGEIVFLGWDWVFSDPPVGGGSDGGWQELLDRAVSQVGGQTPPGVISLSGSDLMIEETGGGTSDDLILKTNGIWFEITDTNNILSTGIAGSIGNGTSTVRIPLASISGGTVYVNLLGGDDRLTLDYSGGNIVNPVVFNGGSQGLIGDSLGLIGGSFGLTTYNYFDADSGAIQLPGNGLLSYDDTEPIVSTITATDVVLNYSGAAETIDITAGGGSTTTVNSSAGEITTFPNPTNRLEINAGGGDDTIRLAGLGTGFDADLTINGETDTDEFEVQAAFDIGAGDLIVDTETTLINGGSISTTGDQTFNDEVLLGSDTQLDGRNLTFGGTVDAIGGGGGQIMIDFGSGTYFDNPPFVAGNDSYLEDGILFSTVDPNNHHESNPFNGQLKWENNPPNVPPNIIDVRRQDGAAFSLKQFFVPNIGSQPFPLTFTASSGATFDVSSSGTVPAPETFEAINFFTMQIPVGNPNVAVLDNFVLEELAAVALTANSSGGGVTAFHGEVGGLLELRSLETNADGRTEFYADVHTLGDVTVNDDVLVHADVTIKVGASGDANFNGDLDSAATGPFGLTFDTGTGTTRFAGSVGAGVQPMSHASGLAFLTTDAEGGTGISGGLIRTSGAQLFQDTVTLTTDSDFNHGGSSTFANGVDGTGKLTKSGSGTMFLPAVNAQTGNVEIQAGELNVAGSTAMASDVGLASGTTLSGTGIVSGEVTSTGGNVSPGDSPGQLQVGGVTLDADSAFTVEIEGATAGTGHDQLIVTGDVDLGGATLAATATVSPALGTQIVIIRNDGPNPVTGTFAGLTNGTDTTISGDAYRIFYTGGDGNDVVLIRSGVVPIVYVDDDWAAVTPGQDPDGAGPAMFFGIDSFATIQEAVDGVDPTGDVLVNPGSYEEAVAIAQSLTLEGSSGVAGDVVTTPPAATSDGISVTAAVTDVAMRHLSVTGACNGIHSLATGAVTLVNVDASSNNCDGVRIENASSVDISSSTFNNNDADATGGGDGIDIRDSGAVTLNDVTANGNDPGIFLSGAASFSDTDGTFSGNALHGIQLIDIAGDVTLVRTRLEDNDADSNLSGDGFNATDGGDADSVAIGGNLLVQGVQISDSGASNQQRGFFADGIAGTAAFENSAGVVQSVSVSGHEGAGVELRETGGPVTFTGGDYSGNGTAGGATADGIRIVNTVTSGAATFTSVSSTGNGDDGIETDGVATVGFSGSTFDMNTGDGLSGTRGSFTITGSSFDSNSGNGLHLGAATTADISAAAFAGNGGDGIRFDSTGILTVAASNGNGNTGQGINVVSSDALFLNGGTWSGLMVRNTDRVIVIGSPVTSTKAIDSETQNETAISTNIDAVGNTVRFAANQDGVGTLGFSQTAGDEITTTNETASAIEIIVNSLIGGTGDAELGLLSAGTTTGQVRISTSGGGIRDANAAAKNIVASGTLLTAMDGVGTFADRLETQVGALEGAGGSGGVFVDNMGDLDIGNVDGLTTGLAATGGSINVTTMGALFIEEDVTASGVVHLETIDSVAAGENLTVRTTQTIESVGSLVELVSGDHLTLEDSSTVLASESVELTADVPDADPGTGSTVNLFGTLDSSLGTSLTTGPDADIINVNPGDLHTVDATAIDSGSGDDVLNIQHGRLTGGSDALSIVDGAGFDVLNVSGTGLDDQLNVANAAPNGSPQTGGIVENVTLTETISYDDGIDEINVLGLGDNDVFNVQPSQTAEITIDGGSPVFGDAGVPPGDTLDFDPLGNPFVIDGKTILTAGGSPDPFLPVHFISIESLPLTPLGGSPEVDFDFDHSNTASSTVTSPTQAGHLSVVRDLLHSDGLGYGWQNEVESFERNDGFYSGPKASLIRDGHRLSVPETFTVDLLNGWYSVLVTLGNPYAAIDGVSIIDTDSGLTLRSGITTGPGESTQVDVAVFVDDGTLDLAFVNSPGHPGIFAVNGLSIRPANLLTMGLDLTSLGASLEADGVTVDAFTLVEAPPNEFVTVSTDLGTILNADADPELAGIQVQTDALGEAEILLRRPSGQGTALVKFVATNGRGLGCSQISYALPDSRNFDFNDTNNSDPTHLPAPEQTATQSGFIGVSRHDMYSPQRGYGWVGTTRDFDDGSQADPLADAKRDGAFGSSPGTFLVDLPDGAYDFSAIIGHSRDLSGMQISVNGTMVSDITVAAENRIEVSGTFVVAGGQATFVFSAAGGSPVWVINSLKIQPVDPVSPFTFGPSIGSVPADGLTVSTVTATTTVANGEQVTVSSSAGTIVTPDVDSAVSGVQVVVSGGAISFDLLAPTQAAGAPTISVATLDGINRGTITDAAFLNYVIAGGRRFDFDHTHSHSSDGPSPLTPGFVRVLRTNLDAFANGFGWVTAPNSNDAGVPNEFDQGPSNEYVKATTDLYRDAHLGSTALGAREFRIEVDSAKTQKVQISTGSQQRDQGVTVTVEGAAASQSIDTTARSFASLVFPDGEDVNLDGLLSITFSATGNLSPFWFVNGVDISEDGTALPPPSALAAAQTRTATGLEPLTAEQLEPYVLVARQAWKDTGLTAAQEALLDNVEFVVSDLNGIQALGLITTPDRIVIDDDGSGFGWNPLIETVVSDRYDLLTVVGHELGHLLGNPDTDPFSQLGDLMNSILDIGARNDSRAGVDGFFQNAIDTLLPFD